MIKYIGFVIRLLIFFGFTGCLWYLLGDYILFVFRERFKYRKILKSLNKHNQKIIDNKFISFIDMALKVVSDKELKFGGKFLISVCVLIFVFCFLLLINVGNIFTALLISIFISSLPLILLFVLLRSKRIDGSYEGESLVVALTNFYKENYYNMREAIDLTSNCNSIGPFSKYNMFRLSMALKSYRSEEELDKAIQTFVFAYNTEWAMMLGMNIKIAVYEGSPVSASLEDIIEELKAVREIVENNKRFNNESIAMIRFFLIPLYLLTVYITINFFDFSLNKFIEYQFLNPLGLKLFILTMAGIAFSFISLILIKKPKFDL